MINKYLAMGFGALIALAPVAAMARSRSLRPLPLQPKRSPRPLT